MPKLGLVLSGGSTKGAYQVGVMKALVELGITQIDGIAGASIGALNGAILTSAPNLTTGTERLIRLWTRLSEIDPLKMDISLNKHFSLPTYLTLLASFGLPLSGGFLNLIKLGFNFNLISDSIDNVSIFSDQPLLEMMSEFLDIDTLQSSIPLYVSIYKQENLLKTFSDVFKAEILGIDNAPSEFKHIQSIPKENQKEILLASAALPLIFQNRKDGLGNIMVDGGIGGFIKNQGNTPVTPLIENGYEHIIVTHLVNGSLWNRYDFPQHINFLEIRPNNEIDLSLGTMFDFSAERINSLQEAGYQDTLEQIGNVQKMKDSFDKKQEAALKLEEEMINLEKTETNMKEAIKLLRNS